MTFLLPAPLVLVAGIGATTLLTIGSMRSWFAMEHDLFRWRCRDVVRDLRRAIADETLSPSARAAWLLDWAEIGLETPCRVTPLRNLMLARRGGGRPTLYAPRKDEAALDVIESRLSAIWTRTFLLGSLTGLVMLVLEAPRAALRSMTEHVSIKVAVRRIVQPRATAFAPLAA